MCGSCHIQSVLIGVEYRNWRRTLDETKAKLCFLILLKHYLDLSTQPNEPEKLLTSNIHLLSPQKWSQFVHLNREKVFPRGQP